MDRVFGEVSCSSLITAISTPAFTTWASPACRYGDSESDVASSGTSLSSVQGRGVNGGYRPDDIVGSIRRSRMSVRTFCTLRKYFMVFPHNIF